ncbi:MAG: hypothetical protein ACOY3X_12680 [Pseudomonadota bacterium]
MSSSDDKQNRLSTLTQDVIAVSKKQATPAAPSRGNERARVPEKEKLPEQRVPPTQDVFRVPAPPPPVPVPSARPAARAAASAGPVWAVAALALAAVVVAVFALLRTPAAPAADPQLALLAVELQAANARVQALEAKLGAAAEETRNMNPSSQAGLLQISAGLRDLRNDLDRLSNEQSKLAAQLGELRTLAGGASRDAKMALSQVDQVGARVATINEQVGSAPRAGAVAAASGDVAAQLKSLSQKTDKMAADIRQLYRLSGQ